ncbi:MAG: 50S ribosomal protein L9 [Pseudomonadota bacterium]|nr:50S ribosomal protein L9 [Pseudomonadota bacterium]
MQVILQEKIKNLGNIGDVVVVKPGYARNCLLRQGKALRATKQNMEAVDARRGELEKLDQDRKRSAQQRAERIESTGDLNMIVSTNAEGRLFGSIGVSEVIQHLKGQAEVDKSEVVIVGAPIRQVGEYKVLIQCHPEVEAVLRLSIKSNNQSLLDREMQEKAKTERAESASEDVVDADLSLENDEGVEKPEEA